MTPILEQGTVYVFGERTSAKLVKTIQILWKFSCEWFFCQYIYVTPFSVNHRALEGQKLSQHQQLLKNFHFPKKLPVVVTTLVFWQVQSSNFPFCFYFRLDFLIACFIHLPHKSLSSTGDGSLCTWGSNENGCLGLGYLQFD